MRRLSVAASSLTRQLDALERDLGARLVNRSTRRISLTDAGARYLDDARRILDALEEADRGVRESDGPLRGTLRVSLPVAFARLHVAPMLPGFLRRYPELNVDVRVSDGLVDLVEERIDVAIRLGALPSSSLIARKLAPHRRCLCASPDYLGEHGAPTMPKDLKTHRCLIFDDGAETAEWHFDAQDQTERITVTGPIRANGSDVLREAAIGGSGLIVMPTWLVGPDVVAGRLRPALTDYEVHFGTPEGAISAVTLPARRGAKAVRAFVDALATHIGSPPSWDRALL
ncbi:MAG: LysR substrate-binding domain-containing protein [Pseudomonadota bacterium]